MNLRRHCHDPTYIERRGAPAKISDAKVREMELILEARDDDHPVETKALIWLQLGYEAGLEDIRERTIINKMGTMDYHKCIACRKGWCNRRLQERRKEFATVTDDRYPQPEDWQNTRFSDECHFGWGPQGKLWIIRKPGTRYYQDCIQHVQKEPEDEADRKRHHVWAAIGYNFRSDLTFYDVPGNKNGKMSKRIYYRLDPGAYGERLGHKS